MERWQVSEDSDHTGPDRVSAAGQERGAGLGAARKFRDIVRVLFIVPLIMVLALVCLVEFVFWTENFEPRTEQILSTERWQPFFPGEAQVSGAMQNMDDGSIVFLTHPEFEDWNDFLESISQDATRAGWVKVPVGDLRFADRGYAVKPYVAKTLRESGNSGPPVRNFFTLEHESAYEADLRTEEVVEITLLDNTGAVLFASYYAYD